MNSFIFIDEFGKASRIFCEACQFNFDEGTLSDILTPTPIISNAKQLYDAGWEKLREINGYICPKCAQKDYLRKRVKNGNSLLRRHYTMWAYGSQRIIEELGQ